MIYKLFIMGKVKNYARFYACLNTIQTVDKEEMKVSLVEQFTGNRTSSLREMTQDEYDAMCDSIDPKGVKRRGSVRDDAELRRSRSAVLKRIQLLGVNTADWDAVNDFCLDRRIAGKVFYELSVMELKAMVRKLTAIAKKPLGKVQDVEKEITPLSNAQLDLLMKINSRNSQIVN